MSFTPTQVRKLRSKLRPQHVKTREVEGVSLSYLEGWHVVAEANRIFGFEGWDREMVSSECVWTKQVNGRFCTAYVTRIRIRVRAGEAVIIREGSGAGESSAATPGQAHEFAAKAAETDATKRALMTFGNAFGLSLYGGTPPRAKAPGVEEGGAPRASAGSGPQAGSADVEGVPKDVAEQGPTDQEGEPPAAGALHPPCEQDVTTGREETAQVHPPSLPVTLPGPDWPQIRPLDEAVRLNGERAERVDKSLLALSEPRRERNLAHLAFVASRPCLICGRNRAHAHHLKFAQPTALGRKVSDEFTVPLCSLHHRELHRHGDERVWWAARSVDALKVAHELWTSRTCSPVSRDCESPDKVDGPLGA